MKTTHEIRLENEAEAAKEDRDSRNRNLADRDQKDAAFMESMMKTADGVGPPNERPKPRVMMASGLPKEIPRCQCSWAPMRKLTAALHRAEKTLAASMQLIQLALAEVNAVHTAIADEQLNPVSRETENVHNGEDERPSLVPPRGSKDR